MKDLFIGMLLGFCLGFYRSTFKYVKQLENINEENKVK